MRTWLKVLIPAAAGLAAFALARAALTVGPPPTAGEMAQLVGIEWYRVQVMGQPNGYACIETEVVETPDGPRLRVTEDLKILIALAGQRLEASKHQVTTYDERLRPASIELVKNEMGRASRLSAQLDGDTLTVESGSTEPGAPDATVKTIQVPDDLASDLLIAVGLVRGEIEVGDSLDFVVYDPEIEVIDRHFVTVDRREPLDGVDALVITARSQNLGIDVVSWVNDAGVMLRQSVPGLMDLSLDRVTEEEALASLVPFELSNKIAVEEHLPIVRSLREVALRVRRAAGPADELIPASDRQSVVPEGEDALVTIGQETPPGDSLPLPISGESLAEYLRPTRAVQSDDPRIVDQARAIVGDETDAWGAAQLLCSWVYRSMRKVSSDPRPITALEALDAMSGDCTEHAILLAALGRAVGLPTKLVTGLAYVGGGFGYHAWTQIYVGRWVEMDPAWGEMTADAGHLMIYASALDEASYARASLATGRTLGAIEIDLIAYTAADGREVRFGEEEP